MGFESAYADLKQYINTYESVIVIIMIYTEDVMQTGRCAKCVVEINYQMYRKFKARTDQVSFPMPL